MDEPAQPIPEQKRTLLPLPLAGATLLAMALSGGRLNGKQTPLGIVALELAGTESKAREVIAAWDGAARRRAISAVKLDYAFIVLYVVTLGRACIVTAERLRGRRRLAAAGMLLGYAQWAAGLLDAIENAVLLKMLHGDPAQPWPRVARLCAIPKFVLVTLGLLYILFGWLSGRTPPAAEL